MLFQCTLAVYFSCVLNVTTSKSLSLSSLTSPDGFVLPVVSSIRLLGVTFTDDLRWNSHIHNVLSKCNKRIFLLRNLKRSGCSSSIVLNVYNLVIRPIILYAYSSFCNLPLFLKEKLLRFEKRVFRIVGDRNDRSVIEAAEQACERLFEKVVLYNDHPLRHCFRQYPTKTRASMKLRPVLARTKRFSSSFIRFAK